MLDEIREAAFAAASSTDCMAALQRTLADYHQWAEMLIGTQDAKERSLIACHAGCDHCCVVNVSVSLVEGAMIVNYLEGLTPGDKDVVVKRLDRLWRRIRGLDDEERLALRSSCAFLDDNGWCCIYPVRPLYCRSVSSTDPEDCKKAVCCKLRGEFQSILMYRYQQQLYETIYQAFSEGLEHAHLDGRSFQLTAITRYLLTHPEKQPYC